jgi:hypothetical protein
VADPGRLPRGTSQEDSSCGCKLSLGYFTANARRKMYPGERIATKEKRTKLF